MNFTLFHFIRPHWLLAFIPYIVIVVTLLRHKLSRGNWSAVCDPALLPYLLQDKPLKQSRGILTTGAIAAVLAIIALAGPTWERLPSPVFRNASALVIALDLSKSMVAEDIKPSRLIRARYKIADILKQRKDGQTALLVYSGDAFTVTPLTDDAATIDSQLSALTTDIMPSEGNNAVVALKKAVELFKQAGLQKGQILLVTDGVDVDRALATAKSLDSYQLSILGVGTDDGAPIAQPGGGFLKDEQGSIVIPKLNAGDLAKLAQAGNGVYQTSTANDSDIQNLLAVFDKPLSQQAGEENKLLLEQWEDKGPWLLLLVLPLAALAFRKGVLCFALLLILPLPKNSYAFEWQDLWQRKDQQAQQAYNNKQYDQAAKLFENPDWKAAAQYYSDLKATDEIKTPESARGFYNQGNVLAKTKRYEDAIKAYKKALELNAKEEGSDTELAEDAQYNKELVEKELEKQKQEEEQKKQEQQKQDQQDKSKQGDKSGQSDNQKQSEQGAEQSANDQKPEQKPEQKPSDKEQSAEQQQQDKDQQEKDKAEQSQQAEQKKAEETKQQAEPKKEQGNETKPAEAQIQPSDEVKQANEQWLKRIPDDPAGLLKRKFKYQYGQRNQQ